MHQVHVCKGCPNTVLLFFTQGNMVKRNPPRKGRGASGIELFMECTDEALSGSQITAQQVAKYQYDQALAKIRDAHAKARIGKARIINKVDVGTVIPQAVNKPSPHVPTAPVNTVPGKVRGQTHIANVVIFTVANFCGFPEVNRYQ